ncbi:hypothetical protein KR009_008235, partial [Drosophila setifemur]
VAKGSMNSSSSRRRQLRLQRRLPHFSSRKVTSSTDTSSGVETELEMDTDVEMGSVQRVPLDGRYQYMQMQQHQQHSSSDSNIKTVLQPTMATNSNHNRGPGVKPGYIVPAEEEDDDGDSGYEFGGQEPFKERHHRQQQFHQNSEGLLSIAIQTIKLVQRNKLLQKRLSELQLETSEFIASVLANPENQQIRETIAPKAEAKSSNVLLRH